MSSPPRSGGKARERMRIGEMNSRSRREGDCAEPIDLDSMSVLIKSHF